MCLNWKVLAGLAAIGLGIYLVAPALVLGAVPLLLLLACPLSMGLMMLGMRGSPDAGPAQHEPPATGAALAPEEQLVQLRARLREVSTQQAELARQLEHLQASEAPTEPRTALLPAE